MSEQKPSSAVSHDTPPEPPPRENPRELRIDLVHDLLESLIRPRDPGDGTAHAEALLHDAYRERASDIHLDPDSSGLRVRFRVDGVVLDAAIIARKEGRRLVNQLKGMAKVDPVAMFVPEEARFDFCIDGRTIDFRVELAPCLNGDKITVRVLEPRRVQQRIHQLGLAKPQLLRIENWLGNVNGMFLVAGPTGSGKTTTLYALLHEFRLLERSVITVEDPVECQINGVTQIQVNESRGLTFSEGIKAMLRLDPDYMLVGEVRDAASARAALDAAVTGRTLMSTLHSRDAVSAVTVLRNFGLTDHEIASVLSMMVTQRLVRKLCPACRCEERPTDLERRWLEAAGVPPLDRVWHSVGCDACRGLGFIGRTGVFEVWPLEEDDHALILEHTGENVLRDHLGSRGHRFLLTDALEKVEAGVTSLSELRTMGGFGWFRSRSPGPTGPR